MLLCSKVVFPFLLLGVLAATGSSTAGSGLTWPKHPNLPK